MTRLAYIEGVTTIRLDPAKCNGCRMCLQVCPHPVFGPLKGAVEILDPDLCIECGACQSNCAFDAIHVNAGVGCAAALIKTVFNPDAEPVCGYSTETAADGCCEGPGCG